MLELINVLQELLAGGFPGGLQEFVLPLAESPFGDELGIESERSRQFSVGIFIFLVFAIFVFLFIALSYMFRGRGDKMKIGEKIMFGWILFGLVAAVAFGASQLLHGYLF